MINFVSLFSNSIKNPSHARSSMERSSHLKWSYLLQNVMALIYGLQCLLHSHLLNPPLNELLSNPHICKPQKVPLGDLWGWFSEVLITSTCWRQSFFLPQLIHNWHWCLNFDFCLFAIWQDFFASKTINKTLQLPSLRLDSTKKRFTDQIKYTAVVTLQVCVLKQILEC